MTNGDKSEKEISKEFYEIFHQTRLMLIRAFQEKKGVGEKEALYYAQRFMHRAIFLFFALDNGLINNQKLFSDTIFERLKKQECSVESKDIWDDISHLFKALDQGDRQLDIHGFGGDLFSPPLPQKIYFLDFQTKTFFANEIMISKISKEPKLEGNNLETWNKFGDSVSPIIKNLLIMDSYDFKNTLNVTILGHILEQSLDDLNEFQKTGEIKRKVEGVFYTPETLTDYICKNTIIPYLSKNNVNTVAELISEYQGNLEELEKKISKIKIVDPACGSGAFLINATQVLHEISESIQMKKGKLQAESGTLDTWQKEIETSKIIENNIFGADINRDSVEITKLSLFLIMAKPGEKLNNLSKNIIRGNSLITDKEIDPIGFVWENKFSEIMNKGGFDIVIGNPPWDTIQPNVDEFFSSTKETRILLACEFPKKNQLFSMLPIKKKKQLMEKTLKNKEIEVRWQQYKKKYHEQKKYFLNPKNYQFQSSQINGKKVAGVGLNAYKLFLEKSHKILKKKGVIGMITPSGIYSDLGSGGLRKLFFERYQIIEICGMINRKKIFQIHAQFKFCTVLIKKDNPKNKFLAKFDVERAEELHNFKKTSFEYELKLVEKSSPQALSILECKNETEHKIFKKMYRFSLLQEKKWGILAGREFNMTDDSKFFNTSRIGYPVFEGKMIYQFKNNFKSPHYWISQETGLEELKRKEKSRMKKILKNEVRTIEPELHCDQYRIVWRDITNATNERGLISTILPPKTFLVNSLFYIIPIIFNGKNYEQTLSDKKLLYLSGILNSFVVDFILRHKISSHASIFYVKELPIPYYESDNLFCKKIFENSTKLTCTTNDFKKLRENVGISEYVTEPEKRMVLEAQINAAAAKIYDLTKEEFEYILESFPSADKDLKEMAMREFLLL
jgi:Alw26I/Eco31I/Esp3I family type II restriction m6 adenine DNA methyltransferase